MGQRLDALTKAIEWYKTFWVGSMWFFFAVVAWPVILFIVGLPFVIVWWWWNAPSDDIKSPAAISAAFDRGPSPATQKVSAADRLVDRLKPELDSARKLLSSVEAEGDSLLRTRLGIEDRANEALRAKKLPKELGNAWTSIRSFDPAIDLRDVAPFRTELDKIQLAVAQSEGDKVAKGRIAEIRAWAEKRDSSLRDMEGKAKAIAESLRR